MNIQHVLLMAAMALPAAGDALERKDAPAKLTRDGSISKEWYQSLYDQGHSVESLIDESRLLDETGKDVGQVENVVFSQSGEALAIIAEISGFFDMSETHVSIPWGQIGFTDHWDRLRLSADKTDFVGRAISDEGGVLTEAETAARVEVEEGSALETGSRIFLAHQLLGDQVYLKSGRRWGNVNDLVIRDGHLVALVIEVPDQGPSRHYAYPFEHDFEHAIDASSPRYILPLKEDDFEEIAEFDYERLFIRERPRAE